MIYEAPDDWSAEAVADDLAFVEENAQRFIPDDNDNKELCLTKLSRAIMHLAKYRKRPDLEFVTLGKGK